MFLTESWFWRGTQSAIFYYASCSPWQEHKHKQKRRKEAEKSQKERDEIISQQPGLILQPGPFQTNPDWAEEIIMGPGPPKGWKKDKMLQGYTESARERYRIRAQLPPPPALHLASPSLDGTVEPFPTISNSGHPHEQTAPVVTFEEPENGNTDSATLQRDFAADPTLPVSAIPTNTTISTSSSSEQPEQTAKSRPSMDRRLSSAVENIKDTIKNWNWKRYEREDEILSGLTERLGRIWDKATTYGTETGGDNKKRAFTYGRKRADTTATNESERYDYERSVRNPEINELHPPVVSKLPATRDAAAWMLLPPPSAAVMAGYTRPLQEPALRWPLAQIDRTKAEWEQIKRTESIMQARSAASTRTTTESKRTPVLSNSSSEASWSDSEEEHEEIEILCTSNWMPMPKHAHIVHDHGSQEWH